MQYFLPNLYKLFAKLITTLQIIRCFLTFKCLVSVFRPKEQKPLYSFSTVTKLPNNVKISQMDSNVPGSAARQHYLSQSRYLPGKTA